MSGNFPNLANVALNNFYTFYGLWGFVFVGVVYVLFLRKQSNAFQRLILTLLSVLPLSVFFIYHLMGFNLNSGPGLNLGLFKLTYVYSDSLPWILALILPVVLTALLIIKSPNWKWVKRIILPLCIGIGIAVIDIFALVRIYQTRSLVKNDPGIVCTSILCVPFSNGTSFPITSYQGATPDTTMAEIKTFCLDKDYSRVLHEAVLGFPSVSTSFTPLFSVPYKQPDSSRTITPDDYSWNAYNYCQVITSESTVTKVEVDATSLYYRYSSSYGSSSLGLVRYQNVWRPVFYRSQILD